MASATMTKKETKEAIVIGIDFGTTFSGVAWCYTGDPKNIRTIKSWPNNNRNLEKVPSVIQYGTKDSSKFQWGFGVTPEAMNPLRWFKLLLNEQSAGTISGQASSSRPQRVAQTHTGDTGQLAQLMNTIKSIPQDKTPVSVVTDYLKKIYEHTRETLENAYPRSFTSSFGNDIAIELCLTVPAIWDDVAKALTLRAARAAGMDESQVKIKTVSEPEAAAVHCLKTFQETQDSLQVGDVYVIADCGGGTVDLISYEVTAVEPRLRVKECVGGTGGLCGSTALNRRFEELVIQRLGTKEWENMTQIARYNTMLYFDEYLKPNFSPPASSGVDEEEDDEFDIETYHCPVPGVNPDPSRGIRGGHLVLSADEMKKIFEPTFVEIRNLVQHQITAAEKKSGGPITGVLLVGGFGSSPYLCKYLTDNLKGSAGGIKILQPSDAWAAIACGAVSYGLSVRQEREGLVPPGSGLVESRIARFSYGISISEPFIAGYHPVYKMYYSKYDGELYCRQRMTWFVKKDDELPDGEYIEVKLVKNCPTGAEPEQLVFLQEILSSEEDTPPLDSENEHCRHLLIFTADLQDVPRKKHFVRKRAANGNGAYWEIPLVMRMKYESASLEFSQTVGGKVTGKGSVEYDHEAPREGSKLWGR